MRLTPLFSKTKYLNVAQADIAFYVQLSGRRMEIDALFGLPQAKEIHRNEYARLARRKIFRRAVFLAFFFRRKSEEIFEQLFSLRNCG